MIENTNISSCVLGSSGQEDDCSVRAEFQVSYFVNYFLTIYIYILVEYLII